MKTRKTSGKNFPSYNSLIEKIAAKEIPHSNAGVLPEIVVITTFPPRQCGIATYSQDLIKALNDHYTETFDIKVCALENTNERHTYTDPMVKYVLNVSDPQSYLALARQINEDENVKIVLIQHEFGLVHESVTQFNSFIDSLNQPM